MADDRVATEVGVTHLGDVLVDADALSAELATGFRVFV